MQRRTAGQPLDTIRATGTETWHLVREGALAGLPVSFLGGYNRGLERVESEMTLTALT